MFPTSLRGYPATRMRRVRAQAFSRALVRQSHLSPSDLIYPLFVIEGEDTREAVPSMPGVERLSIDLLVKEAREAAAGKGSTSTLKAVSAKSLAES